VLTRLDVSMGHRASMDGISDYADELAKDMPNERDRQTLVGRLEAELIKRYGSLQVLLYSVHASYQLSSFFRGDDGQARNSPTR
jgi:hypothetical protein